MCKYTDCIVIRYSSLPFSDPEDEYRWAVVPSCNLSYKSLEKLAQCEISEITIKFKRNDFDGYYKLNVVNSDLFHFDDCLEEC